MVVTCGEGVEVVEAVNGDGVLRSTVTERRGVASNLALGDVVSSLETKKETITTEDGVCGDSGALYAR